MTFAATLASEGLRSDTVPRGRCAAHVLRDRSFRWTLPPGYTKDVLVTGGVHGDTNPA
jgi:hypothetical protein